MLQTLPTGGKFTLLVGGNTVANKKHYRNTTSTKKAERILDNTAPSSEIAHGTSQAEFVLCRQAVLSLEKTGVFFKLQGKRWEVMIYICELPQGSKR